MDKALVDKIGNNIVFDNLTLNKLKHKKIVVCFNTYKECGNDPETYYYSEKWDNEIVEELKRLGFETVLFDSDTIKASDSIPAIIVRCNLLNSDFQSVNIHLTYQEFYKSDNQNIYEENIRLKQEKDSWSRLTP